MAILLILVLLGTAAARVLMHSMQRATVVIERVVAPIHASQGLVQGGDDDQHAFGEVLQRLGKHRDTRYNNDSFSAMKHRGSRAGERLSVENDEPDESDNLLGDYQLKNVVG